MTEEVILYSEKIKNINNELKEEISKNKLIDVYPSFDKFFLKNCEEAHKMGESFFEEDRINKHINLMAYNADNRAFRNITSHRKIVGSVIVFLKRVIRKMLKWYIEPICNQQSDFNHNTVASIKFLAEYLQNNQYENIISNLELKNEMYEKELQLLKEEQKVVLEKVSSLVCERQVKQAVFDEMIEIQKEMLQQVKIQTEYYTQESINDFVRIINTELSNIQNNINSTIDNKPSFSFGNNKSYSQNGEDLIVAYILDSLKIPFNECTYLDIGANHPIKMNNTFYFYCFGANGVLVEANPELISELQATRKKDVVLNQCIVGDNDRKDLIFYILNGDGLSTVDKRRIDQILIENPSLKLEREEIIPTVTAEIILNQYFTKTPLLVSIDTEGSELEILKSINLAENRPLIFIVETIPYRNGLVIEEKDDRIVEFMKNKGYKEYAFTGINSIFIDTTSPYLLN